VPSKTQIDKLADQLKLFEIRYVNKITEIVNAATDSINGVSHNNNDKKGKGKEEGEEEWEEVEVEDWVMEAERHRAWNKYLKDNEIVIDYTDPHNNQYSDIVVALHQQFTQEWNQQPHPRKKIRYKKPTEREAAAWKEERKRIAEYRDENGKDYWGFD
jgi:CRISPR/Cas system CMR subunit Cmr4 (Cas7 group RAMP superfamily)